MKITTTAAAFVDALKLSLKPENKQAIPILGFVKLTGSQMFVTNLDIWTMVDYRAKSSSKNGESIMVPYKQAMEVLKGESGPLVIEDLKNENSQVRLTVNGCEYKLPSQKPGNFPEFPTPSETPLKIEEKTFLTLLSRVRFSISNAESRYTLNGALLKTKRDGVSLVGTDGHRLSLAEAPLENAPPFMEIIPTAILDYLKTRVDKYLEIGSDEEHQTFRTSNVTIISRKITGQFPNYEAVMPTGLKSRIQVTENFSPVLARVAKCADERSGAVKIHFGAKSTIHASSTDRGSATAPLPFSCKDEITAGYNFQYIVDFLKCAGDSPFEIGIRDEQTAAVFSMENFTYVVMPMRI